MEMFCKKNGNVYFIVLFWYKSYIEVHTFSKFDNINAHFCTKTIFLEINKKSFYKIKNRFYYNLQIQKNILFFLN